MWKNINQQLEALKLDNKLDDIICSKALYSKAVPKKNQHNKPTKHSDRQKCILQRIQNQSRTDRTQLTKHNTLLAEETKISPSSLT